MQKKGATKPRRPQQGPQRPNPMPQGPRGQSQIDRREFGGGGGGGFKPQDRNPTKPGLGYGRGGRFGGGQPRKAQGLPGRRPIPGVPGGGQPQGRDYFGEMNAFQGNIAGQQPGALQAGYGGFAGTDDPMQKIRMNEWLNTFTDPVERAQAMNGIGYYNQGNPYTPQVQRGTNQFYRGNARDNQMTGGMSAPGTYLHQSSYGGDPMQFGGYVGATTVNDDMSAQYQAFDQNRRRKQNMQPPWLNGVYY